MADTPLSPPSLFFSSTLFFLLIRSPSFPFCSATDSPLSLRQSPGEGGPREAAAAEVAGDSKGAHEKRLGPPIALALLNKAEVATLNDNPIKFN